MKLFFQGSGLFDDPVLEEEKDPVLGAVIAIQSFGDLLGSNPHFHIPCSEGCSCDKGMFGVAVSFNKKQLEELFRYKLFKILLSKGKITENLIEMLLKWWHSGFNFFEARGYFEEKKRLCSPWYDTALEPHLSWKGWPAFQMNPRLFTNSRTGKAIKSLML